MKPTHKKFFQHKKPSLSRSVSLAFLAWAVSCFMATSGFALDSGSIEYKKDNAGVAVAETGKIRKYNIPAGPFASALNKFASQNGLTLVYGSALTKGLQTGGVKGSYSQEQALRQLLQGTGMTFKFTDSKTIQLSRREKPVRQLKSVTVEGERRRATIKDTASSVIVVDNQDMETIAGSNTVETVLRQVPNVIINGHSNLAPTIRGNDSTGVLNDLNSFLGGARPRTTIQVDGRPLSYNEFVFGSTPIWDLEQVEVFRGPQTTTQGRNSIAGAIFVRTQDPIFEFESRARLQAGNFDTGQASFMLNSPLIEDELAARFTFDRREHETFVTPVPPAFIGDPDNDNFQNFRGKLLFEPKAVPGLSAKLTVNSSEATRPQTEIVDRPLNQFQRMNPFFSTFTTDSRSYILDVNLEFLENFESRNTISFAEANIQRLAPPGTGVANINQDQFRVESILDYHNDSLGIKAIFGVNALVTDQDDFIDLAAFGIIDARFNDMQESVGVFGQVTWTVIDPVDLIIGGRYQTDHQDRHGGVNTPVALTFDRTFDEFLPRFGIALRPADNVTVGADIKKGFNPGGFTFSFATGQTDTFREETLWNYEAYLRSNWINNRLQVNGNFFYTDFDDQQRPATFLVMGMPVSDIDNTESSYSYGAELDLRFLATDQLEVYGGLGLLNTEIETFTASTIGAMPGNEFQRAPSVTANFGFTYEPLSGLILSGQGQYVDNYFSDDANTMNLEVDSYFIAHAQLSYQLHDYVRTFVGVTNITNELYELQNISTTLSQIGDPREYYAGIELSLW